LMEYTLGNQSEAIDAYRTAMQIDPWLRQDPSFNTSEIRKKSNTGLYTNDDLLWEGWEELKSGNFDASVSYLDNYLISNPKDPVGYALLAIVQQESGSPEKAWYNVEVASFVSNLNFRSQVLAAHVASAQGRSPEVIGFLEQAIYLLENTPYSEAFYNAAYNRGSLHENLSPFLVRIGLTSEDRQLFDLLADYYSENGYETKGRRVLNWLRFGSLR
jgi:tetratricopeptide (TPR) repeat protein